MHSQHKSTNRLLQQSIDAIESGHRSQARDLLTQLLRQNEENAQAWYYLARTVDADGLRWKFLRRALAIDPDHTPSRKLIERVFVNLLERYVEKLEAESNRQQQLIDQRARELNALHAEYERLEGNVEALETQREEEQQKLSDLRAKINQGTARLAELKAAQQKREGVIADQRRRVDHLRDQAISLEERIAQHQTTIAELRKRRENLQADIREQEQTIQELEAAQAEREKAVAEQERRGNHLQGQIEQMEQTVEGLQDEINYGERVAEGLEAARTQLEEELAQKRKQSDELQSHVEQLKLDVQEHRDVVAQLEQKSVKLDRQIRQRESKLAELETIKAAGEEIAAEADKQAHQSQAETANILDSDPPLDVLGLPVRPYNALRRSGIETVGQLVQMSQEQIEDIHNIGLKSADEIQAKLAEYLKDYSLFEQLLSFCPPSKELMASAADLFDTPIDELDLSEHIHKSLLEENITSVGWLAHAMHKNLINDRLLGWASSSEVSVIIASLYSYLGGESGLMKLEETEPSQPLIEQSLQAKMAQVPLEDISVERLALSRRQSNNLQQMGIETIDELAQQPAEVIEVNPDVPSTPGVDGHSILTQLHHYLAWLTEQDEDTWNAEASGQDVSPIYRLMLAETSLKKLAQRWLSILNERDRQVLRWRYGYAGENLSFAEIGNRLGVSRERVRQLHARSLRALSFEWLDSPIRLLIIPLRDAFVEAGGVMRQSDVERTITDLVHVGDTDVKWISSLILHTVDIFETAADHFWEMPDAPFHLISQINQEVNAILKLADNPLSFSQLLHALKLTRLYQEHRDYIEDELLTICLRVNEGVEFIDGNYSLKAWGQKRHRETSPDSLPADELEAVDRSDISEEEGILSHEETLTEPQWRACSQDHTPTLAEWETYLRPWIRQVELLGEIPISSEERCQLGRELGRFVRSHSRGRVFRGLRYDYPCSFAVFLTAQGTYGYDGRSGYWPGVSKVIDKSLNPNWTGELGRLFEEIVESFDLPLFPDMGGRRYVDLILAHGGIPDYCLPDFFDNLLQPAVTEFQYADMSVEDLIEEWLWHTSIRYTTDKPVLRFLEFGGKVAQDFVARCREMAWDYLSEGVVPGAEEVGLPERVVDVYRKWIVDQGAEATKREARDRWRLRKPRMLVDPWGEGVILDLPPQQVPATDVHADVRWHVASDEETYLPIHVPIRRLGFDMKTEADSVALREPATSYRVSLRADGDNKRTWSYQGVDEERPLLVFDPERFTLLSWQHSLPARRLGLLYPAKFTLEVEGDAQCVNELPRMPWGWADFQGGIWDLSKCERLILQENGDEALSLAVRAEKSDRPPQLVGGEILTPEALGVRAPVYVGSPPALRIPLIGRQAMDEELSRWQVMVRNKWAADPQRNVKVKLNKLRSHLTIDEDAVELPLGLPVLLGETPFGNFDVRIRGPLGYDAELTLRIVPHLAIQGHDALYLPDPQEGPQPVTFSVEVPPGDRIVVQERQGTCTVQLVEDEDDRRQYAIEVAPEATKGELTVERPLPSGETARVPFSTTVRRVRWALLDDQTPSNRKGWTGQTIKRPIDALLQSNSSYLLVTLPPVEGEALIPTLRLLDIDGTQLQVMEADHPPQGRDIWRFDLSGFLDTIRQANRSPILRFDLSVWNLPDQDEPAHLPVLSLTQKLIVEDIELDVRRGYDQPILDLTWRESTPLRHRRVRLWPVWRPWKGFREYPIADDAEGKRTIIVEQGSGFLKLGKLRVEFLVVDPWAPSTTPQRPSVGSPATADIELASHQERLRTIADEIKMQEAPFGPRLERAFIYADKGPAKASNKDIAWCISHLNQGTIPQILALVDLVKESGDQDGDRQLQIEMFAPGQVDRLLQEWKQGDISGEHFRCYLNNLPDSILLPGETSRYLLSVESETVRLRAAEDLIRQKDTRGLEVLLTWVEGGMLSDADAIALLKLAPDFSIDYLEARVENPVVLRLLEALAFDLGARAPVVRPGTWIYTDAGWGRIERIETPDGQPVEQFMAQENDYRLYVTLRPSLDAESVLVDLTRNLIDFPEAELIHTCAKCKGFSSQNWNLIVERHDCVAHDGISPSYRDEPITRRSLRHLKYSARPPRKAGLGL